MFSALIWDSIEGTEGEKIWWSWCVRRRRFDDLDVLVCRFFRMWRMNQTSLGGINGGNSSKASSYPHEQQRYQISWQLFLIVCLLIDLQRIIAYYVSPEWWIIIITSTLGSLMANWSIFNAAFPEGNHQGHRELHICWLETTRSMYVGDAITCHAFLFRHTAM